MIRTEHIQLTSLPVFLVEQSERGSKQKRYKRETKKHKMKKKGRKTLHVKNESLIHETLYGLFIRI